MNTICLHGCRAEPLLSYLAGIGVVRLVAEQLNPDVSARWDGDHLVVIGDELDNKKLIEFFAEDYDLAGPRQRHDVVGGSVCGAVVSPAHPP